MEDNTRKSLAALRREMEEMRQAYEQKIGVLEMERGVLPDEKNQAQRNAFLKAQNDYLNEYVEIKLFKDNDRYKDDVYVSVNGKNCVIRRGIWTRIRRKFALLLDQSEIQDLRTAELMEKEATRFAQESRLHGA